jgi:GNAT superfamily N-acetyltransferase
MARRIRPLDTLDVRLSVTIRLARRADLRPLEWFGWFAPHRSLISEAFRRQTAGEVLMLVAIAGGFPVGQTWIDLTRKDAECVGVLWAVRVLPGLQGAGIGTALISQAEQLLRDRGRMISEIGVEHTNREARRLYERLGYVLHAREREIVKYVTPQGRRKTMHVDQWLLRRCLTPDEVSEPVLLRDRRADPADSSTFNRDRMEVYGGRSSGALDRGERQREWIRGTEAVGVERDTALRG